MKPDNVRARLAQANLHRNRPVLPTFIYLYKHTFTVPRLYPIQCNITFITTHHTNILHSKFRLKISENIKEKRLKNEFVLVVAEFARS